MHSRQGLHSSTPGDRIPEVVCDAKWDGPHCKTALISKAQHSILCMRHSQRFMLHTCCFTCMVRMLRMYLTYLLAAGSKVMYLALTCSVT